MRGKLYYVTPPGYIVTGTVIWATLVFFLQIMLLGSLMQLSLPVLVIPSLTNVPFWGTGVGSPFGEWVQVTSAPWYIDQLPLPFVDQMMPSQLLQALGLVKSVLPLSHQHWVALQTLHLMAHWWSVLDLALPETLRTGLDTIFFRF